jgi:hypothetical protein
MDRDAHTLQSNHASARGASAASAGAASVSLVRDDPHWSEMGARIFQTFDEAAEAGRLAIDRLGAIPATIARHHRGDGGATLRCAPVTCAHRGCKCQLSRLLA